ncbi:MAG: V-type ATP synthase subunit D [Candidatus Hodarchaeota archaeon]
MINISFRKIRPTKTNLMNLQKRLKFALKGENFLEYKREQLIQQIRKLWLDFESHRNNFIAIFRKSMIKLNQTYKEMGKRDFILISGISKLQLKPTIEIKYIKELGIINPKINYSLVSKQQLPAYSFEYTSHFIDDLSIILKEFFKRLILLAEKEDFLLKTAMNFKKINRRLNGLKNIIIPELELNIKDIKGKLEEIERENFVRLKKTKDLINKEEYSFI